MNHSSNPGLVVLRVGGAMFAFGLVALLLGRYIGIESAAFDTISAIGGLFANLGMLLVIGGTATWVIVRAHRRKVASAGVRS